MTRRYAVDTCRDDAGSLRDRLHEIAEGGGRVVNVIWQPERTVEHVEVPSGSANIGKVKSGYVIVSEYE